MYLKPGARWKSCAQHSEEVEVTASYPEPIAYYAAPGPITDPVEHAFLFDGLSHEMSDLVRTVQGLLLHVSGPRGMA